MGGAGGLGLGVGSLLELLMLPNYLWMSLRFNTNLYKNKCGAHVEEEKVVEVDVADTMDNLHCPKEIESELLELYMLEMEVVVTVSSVASRLMVSESRHCS